MRWKNTSTPRPNTSLRLSTAAALFAGLFVALVVSHWSLLRLPYYWDEAGYYIPAAWDFFRTGSLIPLSTLTNAHPPLPSIYLAAWWKLFGFSPLVTRLAALAAAALGLTAIGRLARLLTGSRTVAFWTVLLTAIYPVWFAQSSLAHADIFAAACTLWGLVYALPAAFKNPLNADPSLPSAQDDIALVDRKPWAAALWFAAAALAKETSIAVPLTLAALALGEFFFFRVGKREMDAAQSHATTVCNSTPAFLRKNRLALSADAHRSARLRLLTESLWLASCVLPLAAWYGWHKHKTGFLFGNPEFLRYNAQANLEPLRFLAAFGHRLLHLTAHMNLFVPVLLALAALWLPLRKDSDGASYAAIAPAALRRILLLLLTNAFFFSVLGGALLTRYLLPMFPLVLLLALVALRRHTRYWMALATLSAAAFVAGLFVNPPYGFAPEDNLAYAHLVRLHQAGIAELNTRYPDAAVLSSWPLTDALLRPELGYLQKPYEVFPVDDFSAAEMERANRQPEKFTVALVFSTKFDPHSPLFTLGKGSRELDERYFGLHQDLKPEAIARTLDGTVVWEKQDEGLWIALIRFHRAVYAQTCVDAATRKLALKR